MAQVQLDPNDPGSVDALNMIEVPCNKSNIYCTTILLSPSEIEKGFSSGRIGRNKPKYQWS